MDNEIKHLQGGLEVRVSDEMCRRQIPVRLRWWQIVGNILIGSRKRYKWVEEERGWRVGNILYVSQRVADSLMEEAEEPML